MIGDDLTWTAGTTTYRGKSLPLSSASTPDKRTTIEIIGPPKAVAQVAIVGQATDEQSATQVAKYMAISMRLILPQWRSVDAWLAASLRSVRQKPQVITMMGWKISMRWIADLGTVALQANRK